MKRQPQTSVVSGPKPQRRKRNAALLAALLWAPLLCGAAVARAYAGEIAAVLSSDSEAYTESLAGFENEWGRPVRSYTRAHEAEALPSDTGIVVAFGTKAALRQYPRGLTLIYWAPGLGAGQLRRDGPTVKIRLSARPETLAATLKEMQPELTDLQTFFISDTYADYTDSLSLAAGDLGITVRADQLQRKSDLPGRMRAMKKKPGAVLILNDPLFIDPQTFEILKDYSWANGVPLYAPSSGLAEIGATASIGPSFAEMGRVAARTARQVSEGRIGEEEVYPEMLDISVNLTAAQKTGVVFTKDFLKKARQVFP